MDFSGGTGDKILRGYIADELTATGMDPKQELVDIQAELARLKKDADRLLDNLTATNRDFVDERLSAIRSRTRELEAKKHEVEAVAEGPLDLEAATTQVLAQMERFREVLDQGSLVQQKEFLRGMIAGITVHPSQHRGVVTYYDLLPASFKCRAGT